MNDQLGQRPQRVHRPSYALLPTIGVPMDAVWKAEALNAGWGPDAAEALMVESRDVVFDDHHINRGLLF